VYRYSVESELTVTWLNFSSRREKQKLCRGGGTSVPTSQPLAEDTLPTNRHADRDVVGDVGMGGANLYPYSTSVIAWFIVSEGQGFRVRECKGWCTFFHCPLVGRGSWRTETERRMTHTHTSLDDCDPRTGFGVTRKCLAIPTGRWSPYWQ
jgi:hypothetical protein